MPKPYIPNDEWSQRAAKEGYRARSVYKLMELDEKFKLLKPGMNVLDCGAAPGSWLQYTAKKIGPKGHEIGLDLTVIKPIAENVRTFVVDMMDPEAVDLALRTDPKETEDADDSEETLKGRSSTSSVSSESSESLSFDLVLSDIAPSTSGIRDIDQWRSIELNQAVVTIARQRLKPGGRCVLKVFRGGDFESFIKELKASWKDVHLAEVEASRDRSKEIYIVMKK